MPRRGAASEARRTTRKDDEMPDTVIPTIDLQPLLAGTDGGLERVAGEVLDVYSNVGFAYLTNHGIPDALIAGLFAASARFHALPRDVKLEIEINEYHRGFIPINTSTDTTTRLATVTKPEQSESFMVMHELAPDDPDVRAGAFLAGPNQWPASLPRFEPAVRAYEAAAAGWRASSCAWSPSRLASRPTRSTATSRGPRRFCVSSPTRRGRPTVRMTSMDRRRIPTTASSRSSCRTTLAGCKCARPTGHGWTRRPSRARS